MDKKLLVFSIFVSLFILGGLSLAEAHNLRGIYYYGLNSTGTLPVPVNITARRATNSTFGTVIGGTSVNVFVNHSAHATLNGTHKIGNVTIYYNTSGSTGWSRATLSSVTSNSTCTSNVCRNTTGPSGGGGLVVAWTVPSTEGLIVVKTAVRYQNNSFALNKTALVRIDTTKPSVTLGGRGNATFAALTNNFVFVNLNRFAKLGGQGINYTMIAKVTDRDVSNCTLWTEFGFNEKRTFAANKTGVNTIGGRYGFLNDSTAGLTKFWNATHHYRGAVPNNKFKWSAVCYDNATTPNYGVPSTNFSFYFDNKTPAFPSTHGVFFEDSDPNAKDTSKTGLFQVGGVWTSELLETLTFTCDTSDGNLDVVTFNVQEPGASVFSTAGKSTDGKKTFEYKETKKSGVYEVKCTASDIAGNKTTSSIFKFRLQADDEGEAPGTPVYVKPFNVDFSKLESKTLAENQGRVLTVSFDGKTEHTIKFESVTSNSVTLIIASHPKTINLNVGDTKSVDVNDDGIDDVSATLTAIIDGKASVDFKKLTGAEKVAQEEGKTTTSVRQAAPPTGGTGRSTIGIWIIVLIVVVGVIIYLVAARRKKK